MPKIFHTIDKIKPVYDMMYKIVLFICKVLLVIDIGITTMAVTGRYVPFIPDPSWSEEIVLTCMAYMAVLSAALAIRRGSHIRMTAFDRYLPKRLLIFLDIIADVAVMGLALVMIFVGYSFALRMGKVGTYVSLPNLSRFWMYFPIPVAGFAMLVFEIEAIYHHIRKLFIKEEMA